ncbi:hypothetical protein GQ457_01G005050 [Hibiscus cannabinus]
METNVVMKPSSRKANPNVHKTIFHWCIPATLCSSCQKKAFYVNILHMQQVVLDLASEVLCLSDVTEASRLPESCAS